MVFDHYQILGIPADADIKLIKAAYRSMAKRFHPDTNKGSEAAAELFRQLNEAYRVLSDAQRRKLYDQKITEQQQAENAQQAARQKQATKPDPQQKFNNFLYSVLGAILETPDAPPAAKTNSRASPQKKTVRKVRSKPDFNFYYYLAKERDSTPYSCGEDGIYRRQNGKPKRNFGGMPGSSAIMLLLTGLWELFKQ